MNKYIKCVLISLIFCMIVSIPVMAVYDADVETKMMESSISNIGGFSCMSLECYSFKTLIGIYESNEHHNKLIAEQNKLLEERNKIAWVELCYAPPFRVRGNVG